MQHKWHIGVLAMGLALGALAPSAKAEGPEDLVVVELFTSQGCASCPPADALMEKLVQDPGVLALSLHVDYWDYIGWADTFASPAYTARQKAYAAAQGAHMLYTPQIMVGGQESVPGHDGAAVRAAIGAAQGAGPGPVQLSLQKGAGQIELRAALAPGATLPGPLWVQLVRYQPSQTVEITRGENAGRKITYYNVVTEWQRLAEWDGQAPLYLAAPYEGPEAGVVLVQSAGPSTILAAARAD